MASHSLWLNILFGTGALSGDFASAKLAARARTVIATPARRNRREVSLLAEFYPDDSLPNFAVLHSEEIACTLAITIPV